MKNKNANELNNRICRKRKKTINGHRRTRRWRDTPCTRICGEYYYYFHDIARTRGRATWPSVNVTAHEAPRPVTETTGETIFPKRTRPPVDIMDGTWPEIHNHHSAFTVPLTSGRSSHWAAAIKGSYSCTGITIIIGSVSLPITHAHIETSLITSPCLSPARPLKAHRRRLD